MKNFRGRIVRVDDNDYFVEDSDSETDSEVGAIYEDDDLQVLFTRPGGPFGLALYTDSDSDSDGGGGGDGEEVSLRGEFSGESSTAESDDISLDDLFIPVATLSRSRHLNANSGQNNHENEAEDVSLEGYFAFGGERRRTVSGRVLSGSRLAEVRTTSAASSNNSSSGGVVENNTTTTGASPGGSSSLTLSPAAIESLSLGEVGLEQILRRAIAMNEASIVSKIAAEEARKAQETETTGAGTSSTAEVGPGPEVEVPTTSSSSLGGGNDNHVDKNGGGEEEEDEMEGSAAKRIKVSESENDPTVPSTTSDAVPPSSSSSSFLNVVGPAAAGSESGESGRTPEPEADVTCNPMVSDVEELEENDDVLRGDRIGATTYSERHVLKILMKWVQELPKYSDDGTTPKEDKPSNEAAAAGETENPAPVVDKNRFLEPDFEEEMALLWDMSFEPDVMNFLVQQNAFNIIRETLTVSCCDRLTEIGLGIMANIISQQSIVEDFSIHDASLKLVEGVVSLAQKMPRVSVLIQVFAVMRRITWFLGNVALVQGWKGLLLSQDFLNCANFILSSSTNALLLGNVIVSLFSILEALSPDLQDKEEEDGGQGADVGGGDNDDGEESASSSFFGKVLQEKKKDYENYHPFCKTEFVSALCEGLNELLKNPKPRKVQKMTSTHENHGSLDDDATDERTLDDMEPQIPEGHVQTAVLNGLSCFVYLYKTPNGKQTIRENHKSVLSFLLNLLRKFGLCTDSTSRSRTLDYFSLGVSLLSFCHKQEDFLVQDALKVPLVTAAQLMMEEEELRTQQKDGISHDSKTFIALVLHEYYASLADNFGQDGITQFKTDLVTASDQNRTSSVKKYAQFLDLVDNLVTTRAAKEEEVNLNFLEGRETKKNA